MSESKTVVLNLRLAPAIMATLEARATTERRPVRTMAAMLIEDALSHPRAVPQVIDKSARHPAGPVLADPVPIVAGDVEWCGLKGQAKGKGKR